MFAAKHDPPLAEQERDGLADAPAGRAPGQKLILAGTAGIAALLILFGVASRYNYFGLFGAPKAAGGEVQADARPVSVPVVSVPLAVGESPAPVPSYVTCPDGIRLPVGMDCPRAEAAGPPASAPPPGESLAQRLRERRLKGSIALGAGTTGAVSPMRSAVTSGEGARTPPGDAVRAGAGAGAGALGRALDGTPTQAGRAFLIANPSLTLAKGTLPDCTLLTAILSDQPGFLKCLLSAPVMSMDGKVVLMEAGTTMEGEYAAGVQAGQTTIFTLWTRAVTPQFVAVPLGSPGTDALGRAGTRGEVDQKWMERFAGAVFFSLLEDAKDLAIARADARAARRVHGPSGDTYNIGTRGAVSDFGNTASTAQSIVQEMLRQGSQVRPSLYKNQGEVIKIFVARDVDFADVYALQPAAPSAALPVPAASDLRSAAAFGHD